MYNQDNEEPETLPWWTVCATDELSVWIPGALFNLD